MLMTELEKKDIDFNKCCNIIRSDTVLTYRLLQKMSTMEYFRGNVINKIEKAIIIMGANNLKRWLLLIVAKENNKTGSDELIRFAFLRGLFAESLIENSSKHSEGENAFLLGIFSLLDKILNENKEKLLENLSLSDSLRGALIGKTKNFYSQLLDFIIDYENQNNNISLETLGIKLSDYEILKLYTNCLTKVVDTFENI